MLATLTASQIATGDRLVAAPSEIDIMAIEQPQGQDLLDKELVRLCQERLPDDPRAFHLLVERHRGHVVSVAYRFLGNLHDAEEAAQEVFLKAYRGLPTFRCESSFSTWLYRIVINTCKNELRRRSRRPTLLDPDLESLDFFLPPEPSAEDSALAHEQNDAIQGALDRLSANDREALILRDVEDLSYQEIAQVLGISLSAAKMRVRRARLAFRKLYSEPADGV